jgi:hypothetical protein
MKHKLQFISNLFTFRKFLFNHRFHILRQACNQFTNDTILKLYIIIVNVPEFYLFSYSVIHKKDEQNLLFFILLVNNIFFLQDLHMIMKTM